MLPSRERHFSYTLSKFVTFPKKLLPITVIHGVNRSGKSNLLKALFFLAQFIIYGCGEDREFLQSPVNWLQKKRMNLLHFQYSFAQVKISISMK